MGHGYYKFFAQMEVSLNNGGVWVAVILTLGQIISGIFQSKAHQELAKAHQQLREQNKKIDELQETINAKLRIGKLEARLKVMDQKLELLEKLAKKTAT